MKKPMILITALILFLSITTVSAGLFGPPTAECKLFGIEIPEDYGTSDGYDPFGETGFYVVDWNNQNGTDRTLHISEVSSFDDWNHSESEQVIETYDDGDVKTELCYDPEKTMYVSEYNSYKGEDVYGYNYTFTEFTKDGHNYVIINEFEGDYHDIDLKKDADIAKQIKKSLWHK
ncbi:MAG: hypothetical protein IJL02_10410 [Methanobrevibacter sp.]|uniref:hypothetical protein n=1 Tax=Methanobrevibacter sp. TaxID=66852 RepID=UPI0025F8251A|nr:hypothetical protein [Methanobrevibacter sp.]MBQ6100256.1 hypothetical protein [Methanobrevibacter sp.]